MAVKIKHFRETVIHPKQTELDTVRWLDDINPARFQYIFKTLPTQAMFAEFTYDNRAAQVKIHLWLYPGTDRRMVWERLVRALGTSGVKWTKDVMKVIPPYNIRGSIYVGMDIKRDSDHPRDGFPRQVRALVELILRIDREMILRKNKVA